MPKFMRQKVIIAKTETTYGVEAATMTMATGGMIVFDFDIKPMEGQIVERKRDMPYYSAPEKFSSGEYVVMTFKVELVGNATKGTAPKWSAIAKACGLAETLVAATSATYNPVSTGLSSASMHVHIDGVKQAILGCRGNAKLAIAAHDMPMLEVTMWGLFAGPTDVANPAGSPSAFQTPQPVNKINTPTFTINGAVLSMKSFGLDFGNKLLHRDQVQEKGVYITDAEPAIDTLVDAVAMSVLNPFALASAQTSFAVNLVHGTVAGKIVTVNAPACQMLPLSGYQDDNNIQQWPLRITPMPTAGSDDYTIVLT